MREITQRMQYVIKSNNIISAVLSPHYNYECHFWPALVVRDAENYKTKVLEKQFQHACTLFGDNLARLARLDRALSKKEKMLLATSLNGLLDLHTLLKKK